MTQNDQREEHIARRVLRRIGCENISPRPRWEFMAKNYFFWTLGALAVALGALAVAATLFEITNVDWRLSAATHPDFFAFFLAAAPFFWIIALAFFILIGYLNVRRTNHGYRYPLIVIALGAVLTSLALGSGLYMIGFGGKIDGAIGDHPPFYRPILIEERSWWLAPEKGLLGGQITSVAPNAASFALRDFSGKLWNVDESDLHNPDLATVARGGIVRIVGLPAGQAGLPVSTTTTFHACFVFPWKTHEGFRDEPLQPPLAAIASTSQKNATTTRSDACKNIRPYRQLRSIEGGGE